MERVQLWPDESVFGVHQLQGELEKYSRFEDRDLRRKVALRVLELESQLTTGNEQRALAHLLQNGHYRGTDIRFTVKHNDMRELVPYPAYRWVWRDTLSYRWKQDAHINELECQALIAHVRRLLKEPSVSQARLMVVVDSLKWFSLPWERAEARPKDSIAS